MEKPKVNLKLVDLDHSVVRMDGWQNLVTGIGTANDKRLAARTFWIRKTPEQFEQLYASDELASRIVNVVPEDAMSKGWEFLGIEKDIQDKVKQRDADLNVRGIFERSWKWARAYGGSCTYIVTDSRDPASPMQDGEQVIGLRDLSLYDLRILTTDVESDFGSPNWGHPKIYYLVVQMGAQFKGYPIHWTRMIRWDGYMVPRRTFIRNNYWHDSILNRLENAIRNYQSAYDAVSSMLQDFNIDVYKMKNLANLIAAGKEDIVRKRIDMMNFSKSSIRALIMDSDDEDYINVQKNVGGVSELLEKMANRLVAATDIPHTKLLGESPDGSNATGNSTTLQWHDHIQAEQENYLRPRIKQLYDVLYYDIPDLAFKFKPLMQLTELEQADLRNKVAQTDQIYLSTGVLDPSEVTQSRFGGDEYSMEIELDQESRDEGLIGPGSDSGLFPQSNEQGEEPNLGYPDKTSNKQAGSHENFEEKSGLQPPEGNEASKENAQFKSPANEQNIQKEKPTPKKDSESPRKPVSVEGQFPLEENTLYQSEGSPEYSKEAFNPSTKNSEKKKETAGLPDSLKPIDPNRQGAETLNNGTQFDLNNQTGNIPPKVKPFISQTCSEPFRDPATDPHIKPGGRPNQPRIIEPTIGNGVVAPSGTGVAYKQDSCDATDAATQDWVSQFAPKEE